MWNLAGGWVDDELSDTVNGVSDFVECLAALALDWRAGWVVPSPALLSMRVKVCNGRDFSISVPT